MGANGNLHPSFLPLFPVYDEQFDVGIPVVNTVIDDLCMKIPTALESYELALGYMLENQHNAHNLRAVRKELNILFNWCWFIKRICVSQLDRLSVREFIDFCQSPPEYLITHAPLRNFVWDKTHLEYIPNEKWRPFQNNGVGRYVRKEATLKSQLSILGSFYSFLVDLEFCERNPPAAVLRRLTSANMNVSDNEDGEKSLTSVQWQAIWSHVVKRTEQGADGKPNIEAHRLRFLVALLYHLYPRISEVSARPGHTPTMGSFRKVRGHWFYYIPRSKRGKSRMIPCTDTVMSELKLYRKTLGLSDFPAPSESEPLLIRVKAASHGREAGVLQAQIGVRAAAQLVKDLFLDVADTLSDSYEAEELRGFSPHNLRHTGIQRAIELDVPLHVIMKNSGHSDLGSLSKYSVANLEAQARYA